VTDNVKERGAQVLPENLGCSNNDVSPKMIFLDETHPRG
jgi:hypothetical protein